MTLRQTRFSVNADDFNVLNTLESGSVKKHGSFEEFNLIPKPGKLYFTTRAISARVNRNYDGFPSQELKKAHRTFIRRPYFVNHANTDHTRTRGIILDSIYKENGNDKYIKLLCGINANAFPRLAGEIAKGNLDGVSMGVDVERTICSYCHNVAKAPEDFCNHVLYMKGQTLVRPTKNGGREDVLVFESCYGLNFFELSSVFDPADETALVQEVLLPRMAKTAQTTPALSEGKGTGLNKLSFGESTAPPRVNTLRDETNCPQCGDDGFDGSTCQWCGYNAPPGELQDPDLGLAKKIEQGQEDIPSDDMGGEVPPGGGGLADAISETIENLEGLFELEQVVQQFAQGIAPTDSAPILDEGIGEEQPPAFGEEVPGEEVPGEELSEEEIPGEENPGDFPQDNMDTMENDGVSPVEDEDEIPTLQGENPPTEEESVEAPVGTDEIPEEGPVGMPPENTDSDQQVVDLEQQVQDLVDGVEQLVKELSGDSDSGTGEGENPEMPRTTSRQRTPALSSASSADRVANAQRRLEEAQKRLADLSKNVVPHDGEEAIADTPPGESGTSSTDAERSSEDFRTNVQDLDANPSTQEREMKPDKREPVEVTTRSVAKVKEAHRRLGSQDIVAILAYCDKKYAAVDLGTALAKASYDFARKNKISSRSVLAQVLTAATKSQEKLSSADRKSLAAMNELFVRRVKAEENNDVYDMMSNKDNLQAAKPTDRVDVEAPVLNDTNDYAQASQFDPAKFDNNRGSDIAKPDDVNTMNWWPGEKPTVHSNYTANTNTNSVTASTPIKPKTASIQKASAVDAIKLAETYIDLGVISADLKFDKIAEFEGMTKEHVQQQQLALDAVRRATASANQRPRGIVPRAAAGHRPVPQMGRAASYSQSSPADDAVFLAL